VRSPHDVLTAQQLQIPDLAAQGLSNREIGERLFLSPRTVGSHLSTVYPKLGVTNRVQLAAVFAAGFRGGRVTRRHLPPLDQSVDPSQYRVRADIASSMHNDDPVNRWRIRGDPARLTAAAAALRSAHAEDVLGSASPASS
jgi:DNA-binding CsgD family transcriptional regulator